MGKIYTGKLNKILDILQQIYYGQNFPTLFLIHSKTQLKDTSFLQPNVSQNPMNMGTKYIQPNRLHVQQSYSQTNLQHSSAGDQIDMPHSQSNTLTKATTMMSTSQTFPGIPVACSTSANMEHSLPQYCTASSHLFVAAFIPIQKKTRFILPKTSIKLKTHSYREENKSAPKARGHDNGEYSSLTVTRDECDDNRGQQYPEQATSDNCGYDNGEHSSLIATRDECENNKGQQYPEQATNNNCGYDNGEQSDISARSAESAQSPEIKAERSRDRFQTDECQENEVQTGNERKGRKQAAEYSFIPSKERQTESGWSWG